MNVISFSSNNSLCTKKNLNCNINMFSVFLSGGWYLSVPELKAGQKSVRGARLAVQMVPPWSCGDACFSFSHWLTGNHVGVLQLFVRTKGRNQRYRSENTPLKDSLLLLEAPVWNLPPDWLLQVQHRPVEQDRWTRLETHTGYLDDALCGQGERHTHEQMLSFVWVCVCVDDDSVCVCVCRCCWRPSGDKDGKDWSLLMMSHWDRGRVDDITDWSTPGLRSKKKSNQWQFFILSDFNFDS